MAGYYAGGFEASFLYGAKILTGPGPLQANSVLESPFDDTIDIVRLTSGMLAVL
jgi:hypothetical protein